jgi:hypothetical protein
MKNIRRFITITLIIISTIFLPSVFAANDFDLTVYEVNNTDNTVTGSGVISTNSLSDIKIEWVVSETGAGSHYEVMTDFSGSYTKVNASRITSNSWTILSSGLPDEGTYHIRVDAYDQSVGGSLQTSSYVVTIVVDETAPIAVTGFEVLNGSNVDITDTTQNIEIVKLSWDDMSGSEPNLLPQPYRVYYYLPNRAPVEITDIANISGVVANSIDVGPNGLGFFDTLVTFQVTATDTAYNESVVAEASFTLDTKTPGDIRNLVMEDLIGEIEDGGYSNDVTRLEWLAPSADDADTYAVYYKLDDGAYVSLAAGINDLFYTVPGSVTATDGEITFKVTSEDLAGNESAGIISSFTLDTIDPVFTVTYVNNNTSNVTDIDTNTLNFVEKQTITVNNNANDIVKFSVSTTENFVNGDREDLEEFLRNLSTDAAYIIKVQDRAGNESTLSFTLNQAYPALPTNQYLTVTSLDLEDLIGVQSNVTISWNKSTDINLDHYEIYVNGELKANDVTNSGVTGNIVTYQLTLDTVKYGDVENYYEVRTYDAIGNYGIYRIQEHVTEDLVKPSAKVLFTRSFEEEIEFTVSLFDYNRVIDDVYAVLYEGSQEVTRIPISTGINTYVFEGLKDGQNDYKIKIESDFDYDSVSYNDEVINPDTVYNIDTITSSNDVLAEIKELDATESSVSIELETIKDSTANESVDVKIYQGLTLIATEEVDLDTDDLTTLRTVSFSSLNTGQNFQIRIVDGSDVLATANFFTQKDVPTVEFRVSEIEGESISIKVVLSDDDGAINLGVDERVIRIYEDGQVIQEIADLAVGTNNITFTDLDFDTEYEFRVYSSYNLENGRGRIVDDHIGTYTLMTAKETPVVNILNVEVTDSTIVFDVDIEDDYNANITVKAVLYEGVNEVGQEILLDNRGMQRNKEFTFLDSLTNYRINIEIVYDLNDGNGEVINNLFYGVNATTLKAVPSIDVSSLVIDNTSIVISARIIDDNNSYENGLIKLFEEGKTAPVDMFTFNGTGTKTFTFTDLDPNTFYRLKVDAEIDLSDGEGVFDEIIYDEELQTHRDIGIDILSIQETFNSITFTADIFNYVAENIYAKLYLEDDMIGTAKPMIAGENEVVFEDLMPDRIYTVRVEYSNGDFQLWEYQIATESIVELETPTIEIVEQSVEGDILTIKVEVSDPDSALTSEIVQIRICNEIGLCTVQEINISILETGIELQLPYEKNTVEFIMEYDNIKEKGTISDMTDQITPEDEPVDPVDPVDPTDPEEPEEKVGFFKRIWNWIKGLFS